MSRPGTQLTLWDLLRPVARWLTPGALRAPDRVVPAPAKPVVKPVVKPIARPIAKPVAKSAAPAPIKSAATTAGASAQERYDDVARAELAAHGIKVRRWRTAMSGVAWNVRYRDGRTQRYIEAPRPKGPMSVAVFLHEVGHHAIGFDVYSPRCLEEYHAWRWSLEAMERHGLNITDAVRHRMHLSLWYAVDKARRRGIKQVPAELTPFLERPPRPSKARRNRAH